MAKSKSETGAVNVPQLNIVTFVDVRRANVTGSLYGNVHMSDNHTRSRRRGSASLQTVCSPGQTLNWIIYPIDAQRRPNGTWPPSVRINNLVFLGGDRKNVSDIRICTDLQIFGGPDEMRSPVTPVYYYWAGTVVSSLAPGVYPYRFVLELDTEDPRRRRYMNLDTPSLQVVTGLDGDGER